MSKGYYDIHTHTLWRQPSGGPHCESVYNLCLGDILSYHPNEIPVESKFSVGIHPWDVVQMSKQSGSNPEHEQLSAAHFLPAFASFLETMKELKVNNEDVVRGFLNSILNTSNVAIGEIGLDRCHKETLPLQLALFVAQLKLADELGKPVVIHCVRAYADVLSVLKQVNPSVPLIFHDFRGNATIAQSLLRWDSYFSFGVLGLSKPKVELSHIHQKLFLETDVAQHSIDEVYERASVGFGVDLSEMSSIIGTNWNAVFG